MLVEKSKLLSVPKEQDIILISPEQSQWREQLAKNILLTKDIPNRSETRRELLQIARDYTVRVLGLSCKSDAPEKIIATGHQAIWHHCGIWAKSLTAGEFAKAVGGRSLYLVLDHDICDTTMLMPARGDDGNWYFQKKRIGPERKAATLEFRQLPDRKRVRAFLDAVIRSHPEQLCNHLWSKSAIRLKGGISRFRNIADLITYLQSILSIALGLEGFMYLPVSLLSQSDAFANFVISIAQQAERFANIYNTGIGERSSEGKDKSVGTLRRLMQDEQAGLVELPFWLIWPDGKRESLHIVARQANGIGISTSLTHLGNLDSTTHDGKKEQLKSLLHQAGCVLRPKAVTLTLFTRLFLADWFVHGVGAGRYEPVTDYVIENYYDLSSPAYGAATCTMKLPVPENVAFADDNISQLKHNLHDVEHNPERYISDKILKKRAVATLLRTKKKQIAQANDRTLSSDIRKASWLLILETNQKLFEYAKGTAEMLERKVAECEQNKISREIFDYREFFFGLFPEDRLRKLAQPLTFAGRDKE
jgi:hypothetical protein